jgi:hypothetical protein
VGREEQWKWGAAKERSSERKKPWKREQWNRGAGALDRRSAREEQWKRGTREERRTRETVEERSIAREEKRKN